MWFLAAAMVASAAATAISAKSSADEGIIQQNAANAQASGANRAAFEADQQSKDMAVQAEQDTAIRMGKLAEMIGVNAAAAAGAGLSADSGSVEAIEQQNRAMFGRDIANIAYIGRSRVAATQRQANYNRDAAESYAQAGTALRSAATTRMWGQIIKGVGTLATYGSLGMGGGGGGAGPYGGPNAPRPD